MSINGIEDLTSNGDSPTVNMDNGPSFSPPTQSNEVGGLDKDEMYELEFGRTTNLSESRPKPVAKPRRRLDRSRHASAPGLEIVQNGPNQSDSKEMMSEGESHDLHPTPSRSAPAPPNAVESHGTDRVSYIQ